MRLGLPFIVAHLVAAVTGLLLAATTVTRPGRSKWLVQQRRS